MDSTNLEARRRVESGEHGPLWIIAGEQTAGRGRLGRQWVSKPGNLYATLIWPTHAPLSSLAQISFVAAIAVYETACAFAEPVHISLKWPNDCLLGGAKFCGILAEQIADGLIAIGIGINISQIPTGLPYPVTRLERGNPEQVLEILQLSLSKYLAIWDEGRGFPMIREAWMERSHQIGSAISVDKEPGTFTGLATDGALLFTPEKGAARLVYAGDVRVEYQPQS